MYSPQDRFSMQAKAAAALSRLKNVEESAIPKQTKQDYTNLLFEEFDEEIFNTKMKADKYFLNVLVNKLDDKYSDQINEMAFDLFNSVKKIYEHININPRTHAFNLSTILTESEEILNTKANRAISDFITRKYYNLTQEQREVKYFDRVKDIATSLMTENAMDPDLSIQLATKSIIIKDLLENISFPGIIKDKVDEALNSKEYGKIFDQESLLKDWTEFNDKAMEFSKIVSVIV